MLVNSDVADLEKIALMFKPLQVGITCRNQWLRGYHRQNGSIETTLICCLSTPRQAHEAGTYLGSHIPDQGAGTGRVAGNKTLDAMIEDALATVDERAFLNMPIFSIHCRRIMSYRLPV